MEFNHPDRTRLREILSEAKTIAVVGLSDNPKRTSYHVAEAMQKNGYRIIPVNPNATEVLGERSYARLSAIPEQVDIVNVFRKSEHVPLIVEEAVVIGAKVLWLQLGVIHLPSAKRAKAAGLEVVMDRCIKVDHALLIPLKS